jgi:hypothetical protein
VWNLLLVTLLAYFEVGPGFSENVYAPGVICNGRARISQEAGPRLANA